MTYTAAQAAAQTAPRFGTRRRARWVASPDVTSPGLADRPVAGTPGRTDRGTTGVTR
ncbi:MULTISPECIES: hypothetical protein [unclassified Streptomyces]|uniref:hypothetical protein n=1 Tax=unclassified Streptomyces TaxID=2593676 RepID=UPI00339EBC1C